MHRLFGWAIALTMALSPSLVLAAREPLKLVPVSKWHVDYAEERCRLAREFGDGTTKATVFFDKYGPGESFRMVIADCARTLFCRPLYGIGLAVAPFGADGNRPAQIRLCCA